MKIDFKRFLKFVIFYCVFCSDWLLQLHALSLIRRFWWYQRGNLNPYIEEEQTTQWQKKVQRDKQRSTKHTHKTKYWVTRIPLKTAGELRYSGRGRSPCPSGTRRVNLVTNLVISHEWGTDWEVSTTYGLGFTGKCLRHVV